MVMIGSANWRAQSEATRGCGTIKPIDHKSHWENRAGGLSDWCMSGKYVETLGLGFVEFTADK